jgi:hypothetical protein
MQTMLILKGPQSELHRVLDHVETSPLWTLVPEPWWAIGVIRKWFWDSIWEAGEVRAGSVEWHTFYPMSILSISFPCSHIPSSWLYRLAQAKPYLGVSFVFNSTEPALSGVCRVRSVRNGASRRLRVDMLKEPFADAGVFSRVIQSIGEELPYGNY